MKNMNECGVWIDKKHATIVKLKDGQETINKIESGIDSGKSIFRFRENVGRKREA